MTSLSMLVLKNDTKVEPDKTTFCILFTIIHPDIVGARIQTWNVGSGITSSPDITIP